MTYRRLLEIVCVGMVQCLGWLALPQEKQRMGMIILSSVPIQGIAVFRRVPKMFEGTRRRTSILLAE